MVNTLQHVDGIALGLATVTLMVVGIRLALSVRGLRSLTEERHRQAVTHASPHPRASPDSGTDARVFGDEPGSSWRNSLRAASLEAYVRPNLLKGAR